MRGSSSEPTRAQGQLFYVFWRLVLQCHCRNLHIFAPPAALLLRIPPPRRPTPSNIKTCFGSHVKRNACVNGLFWLVGGCPLRPSRKDNPLNETFFGHAPVIRIFPYDARGGRITEYIVIRGVRMHIIAAIATRILIRVLCLCVILCIFTFLTDCDDFI